MGSPLFAAPLWQRLILILLLATIAAGWPRVAGGQSLSQTLAAKNHRPAVTAPGQCVQAVNRVEGDVLVNLCNECRIADITHKRQGDGFPLTRSYRVPESGRVELSFRGSGKTRVVSEHPCETPQAQTTDTGYKDCAKLARHKNGDAALINACPVCRGVVIERLAGNGQRQRETFALSGRTLVPVPLRGAAKITIVSELACPG